MTEPPERKIDPSVTPYWVMLALSAFGLPTCCFLILIGDQLCYFAPDSIEGWLADHWVGATLLLGLPTIWFSTFEMSWRNWPAKLWAWNLLSIWFFASAFARIWTGCLLGYLLRSQANNACGHHSFGKKIQALALSIFFLFLGLILYFALWSPMGWIPIQDLSATFFIAFSAVISFGWSSSSSEPTFEDSTA